jgi:4-hydroxy-3-polyprenylbenzoate decarboxylase
MGNNQRLIIGISGASGVVYGIRLLELLQQTDIETHLVVSQAAAMTLRYESDLTLQELEALADVVHNNKNIAASISSGSFRTLGMVIAPCSVRSMSEIASGVTSNLLTRAADVVLKERRRLVLMVRETPLHSGHLQTMLKLSDMGAIVAPPLPAFYSQPATIDDIIDQSVGRVLDLFDIECGAVQRWETPGGL